MDRVWTLRPLASRMIETLQAVGRLVPDSLRALAEDSPLGR